MQTNNKMLLLILLLCMVVMRCSQIDEYVEDNYESPFIPSYTISRNIEGKLLVKLFQQHFPGINGSNNVDSLHAEIINLASDSLQETMLLINVFQPDSAHVRENLMLSKVLMINTKLAPGMGKKIFLDNHYDKVLKTEAVDIAVIKHNNGSAMLSGIYNGTFTSFKSGNNTAGRASGWIDYLGEMNIELARNESLLFLNALYMPSDTAFIGNALSKKGVIESQIIPAKVLFSQDSLTATFKFSDADVYDSLILRLKRY